MDSGSENAAQRGTQDNGTVVTSEEDSTTPHTAPAQPRMGRVYSRFSSSGKNDHESVKRYSANLLMSNTSPWISSALYQCFPILILIDNFLAFITWTNDDPYYNFLCCSGLVFVILNWNRILQYAFPLLTAFVFSCFAWSVQSIVNSTAPALSDETPTIQEILDTLENIATRCAIIAEPLTCLSSFKNTGDLVRLALCSIWITPLQVLVLTHVVSLEKLVVFVCIITMAFYSPWFTATRRLLWRSIYTRKLASLLTGIRFNTANRENPFYDQQSFKILSTKDISAEKNGKIIQFEILENQRRWVALGWSEYLLPYERTNFSTVSLAECASPEEFQFTTLHSSHQWRWLEGSWRVDYDFNKNRHPDGWVYYDNNWKYPTFEDGVTKYTRSRKWSRKAVLIVDKPV